MLYIKILNNPGELSLKNIKFPVVVQARHDIGYFVCYEQFEHLPGFKQEFLCSDIGEGETEFLFFSDDCEIFKD